MPSRIDPIDEALGALGGPPAPEPIETVFDRPGVVQSDVSLDESLSPRPVDALLPLETVGHQPLLPLEPLDTVPHPAFEPLVALDTIPHAAVEHPLPLDTLAVGPVVPPAPIDAVSHEQHAPAPLAPLDVPSHEQYAPAPLTPIDLPTAPLAESPPFSFPEAEAMPFYDHSRRIPHDMLYHNTHWMM